MSTHASNEARISRTAPGSKEDMEGVIAQTRQICNAMTVALKEVHCYLVPRVAEFGVILDAQAEHAWAMSVWITMSRDSKAQYRMPARRLGTVNSDAKSTQPKPVKSDLFSRTDPPLEPSKALTKVRQMMQIAALRERELLAVLCESGMKEALCAQTLSEIPDKVLHLVLQRWETICELIQAERQDQPTYE